MNTIVKGSRRSILRDPSLWLLLLSNVATIAIAIQQEWGLMNLLWVYWIQSVVIGYFNFRRMREAQSSQAFFFAMHYGIFHVTYLGFLAAWPAELWGNAGALDVPFIVVSGVIFLANHTFSYFYHAAHSAPQNSDTLFWYPYARVLPMHLAILTAAFLGALALPLFLALKTIADLVMHIIEHRYLRQDA